jgi:hypothetical protein
MAEASESIESFLETERAKNPDCSFSIYTSRSCRTNKEGKTECGDIEQVFRKCMGDKSSQQVFSRQSKSVAPDRLEGIDGQRDAAFGQFDHHAKELDQIMSEFDKFGTLFGGQVQGRRRGGLFDLDQFPTTTQPSVPPPPHQKSKKPPTKPNKTTETIEI